MYGNLRGADQVLDAFIDGAEDFHRFLIGAHKPFVYLSDSGCKGSQGVDAKFRSLGLDDGIGRVDRAWTAADALAAYLLAQVPPGAKVLVLDSVSFFDNQLDSCLRVILRRTTPPPPWDIKVDLDDTTAKQWADEAASGQPVLVIFCADGGPAVADGGPAGLTQALVTRASWLLANGATLVGSAPDDFVAYSDPAFPSLRLWMPGPGPWLSFLRQASGLQNATRDRVVGKGGSDANQFMFGEGLRLLTQQVDAGVANASDLIPERLVTVGDTLRTDIAGGQSYGTKTVFITGTGVNTLEDLAHFPHLQPTCFVPSIKELLHVLQELPEANPEKLLVLQM